VTRDTDTKVTKLRKISNDLLAFDFKDELLEVGKTIKQASNGEGKRGGGI
jgi:hypothetical protein